MCYYEDKRFFFFDDSCSVDTNIFEYIAMRINYCKLLGTCFHDTWKVQSSVDFTPHPLLTSQFIRCKQYQPSDPCTIVF